MPDVILNLAGILSRSRVNGPGVRAVVWVQGCTIRCSGCYNSDTHPHTSRLLVPAEQLGKRLASLQGIDGVTISGGEPFEQAEACAVLAETIQKHGLNLFVFTGYTYSYLHHTSVPEVRRFLKAIDVLIAGPYIAKKKTEGKMWIASANQKIYFITKKYTPRILEEYNEKPNIEIVTDGIRFSWNGFPANSDLQWLFTLSREQEDSV